MRLQSWRPSSPSFLLTPLQPSPNIITTPTASLFHQPTSPKACMDQSSTNSTMKIGKLSYLWTPAVLVALASILLVFYSLPASKTSTPITLPSIGASFEFLEDAIALVRRGVSWWRRHHHHHDKKRRPECHGSKWASNIVSTQNVTLIFTVDLRGCANFSSVQEAIDTVPDFSPNRTLILINSGVYREKVVVWANKTNVTVQGQGYLNTSIAWNATANSSGGTNNSASFSIFAFNFIAYNISFQNTAPPPSPGAVGAQAVALMVSGDQAAFYGCGIYGAQDTLLDDQGRHYFRNCFIQGSIDFIFGNARSLYEGCTINSIANDSTGAVTGCVTAQGRQTAAEKSGFSFVNCSITGSGKVWLGRAWKKYSTVVFARTSMAGIIAPEGWDNWNDTSRDQTVVFGEYKCVGAGANCTGRVPYSKQLGDCEAAPFTDISYIDGSDWVLPLQPNHWSNPHAMAVAIERSLQHTSQK